MSSNIIKSPFPPITNNLPGKIIKIVKKLSEILKTASKEASEIDSKDSLENIERIMQIFTNFKDQIHSRSAEIEKAVEKEVIYYSEELQNILTENSEKITKYGIHTRRIERQIDKIAARTRGIIDNQLSKKVSLDNVECKEIMKMIPGSKKEAAMEDFFAKTIKEALDVCCAELHSSLNEIYDDVEVEIIGTLESIQTQTDHLQESFAAIDETNYEETAGKQMAEANYLSGVCDMVLDLL